MLRRLRHALLTIAATLGLVVLLPAAPAQAVCNDNPNECARIVHSVYSDVANLSVTRIYPAQSGYIEALCRGCAGTYAGWYTPVGYQSYFYSSCGSGYRLPGWRFVGSSCGSYVVELQKTTG